MLLLIFFNLSCNHPVLDLPQDAYVWQRRWTPAVIDAVSSHGPTFARLGVLAAERTWPSQTTELHPDASALAHQEIVAVLRIAAWSETFEADQGLPELAARTVSRLRQEGLNVTELQLDFDAASSQLGGYTRWVRSVHEALDVPLTITGLPDWLRQPALPELLAETDGWTLQIHDFTAPESPDALRPLLNPTAARAAIRAASALGHPFRIALPTYAYTAAFTPEGRYLGATAEREQPWSNAVITREISADPAVIAALVADLNRDRPAHLIGLSWFRLPTETDDHAWRWSTLLAVRAGQIPASNLRAEAEPDPSGLLVELRIHNHGDADAPLPPLDVLSADQPIAADGYGAYSIVERAAGLHLIPREGATLRAGGSQPVGWLRLATPQEVSIHVQD